ncbi:hypothetical protein [Sphingomonas sp. dw_22]|uniref:hypothetical protein n=1 Tax=Sphingomonas sp. dw_22 TaxID=2721175 RepID=UPI002115FA25|nr:hypothetical protein [Sphingomonas sp. dw_22]
MFANGELFGWHLHQEAIPLFADHHGISMKTAGLQFVLANPAVATVIRGPAGRAGSAKTVWR